ncbi:MAG: phosphodiester glycosidase family protein [Oscillospiraceae bacterium]|nr:phosphodiester glycosidase family protein [Oscillospiraceae bacterium]
MNSQSKKHPFLRFLSFLGVTLLCLALILVGLIWVLEKGPSPTMTGMFARSVRETSAIRWISTMFLSEEDLEQYKSVSTEDAATESINTSLIHVSRSAAASVEDSVEVVEIAEGTAKGKLLLVRDPKQVILGTSAPFVQQAGLQLTDMVAKYDGIAGINAGGFNDDNGLGNGGTPLGLVISEGELLWGSLDVGYNVVGLDGNGILHVGSMSGRQALDAGIQYGVSFVTHDGLSSSLIINGEVQYQNLGGGVNPRTAIGQRKDGAILLLVLDGRSISTLGASLEDVVNIMLEYGAVNAGNLDGGSSSVMVYGGEIINHCSSVTGPRRVPTGFIVLKAGDALD